MRTSPIDIILLLVSILSLPIPFLVYLRNRKSPANISFALFALGGSLWAFDIAMFRMSTNIDSAWFWNKAIYFVGNLPAVAFLYFSFLFPKQEKPITLLTRVGTILPALVFSYFIFFTKGLFIKDVILTSDGNHAVLGPVYLFWMIWFGIFMGLALINLINKYRATSGVVRMQLKFIFFSLIFPMTCSFPFNMILPYLGNYRLIWIGPLSILGMIAIIFYAIIKHRFMNIRLALRAALVRLVLILVLAGAFVELALLGKLVLGEINWEKGVLSALVLSLFTALFFEPALKSIRSITDKILFQREYSHQELLKNLGKMMAESLDLDELLESIRQTLQEVMRVSFVGFVLLRKEEASPLTLARGPESLKEYFWAKDNLLLEQLRVNPQILVYDELKREISEKPEGLVRQRLEQVTNEMDKIKAAVAVPLPSSEGIVGMIVLGEKKGGDAFTSSDIATLQTLMYQAGIAIENASLFTQVRGFNRTLKREIAAATADLAAKNKRLSVLRRLDEIIINTPDLSEMTQKIVDTISWEMGYLGGILFLLDDEGRFRAKVTSQTPALKKTIKSLSRPLSYITFELSVDPSNLLTRAVQERMPFSSDSLADFLVPGTNHAVAKKFQKEANFNNLVAFSLSSKGKPLGALLFALNVPYKHLPEEEEILLEAFVDQAGIALENAKLYSDLKEANLELRRSYAKLKELDKMKDELVSISSHELRTPMTSIKSYLWMALNKADNLTPKLKRYLERAYVASDRMIKLVEDMLSVSRIDAGRVQLAIVPTKIENLISSVISELKVQAEEKGIDLVFEKPKRQLPKVFVDKDKIHEVLTNLLDNALKFTPKKGKVTISCRRRGKMVETSITDTGSGIPKEDLPKLFQKFGRLEHSFATMAESAGGTGLGLYIVKNIINLHRGKVWVKSKIGKGSAFTFSLRAAEEQE